MLCKEIMKKDLVTCPTSATAVECAVRMAKNNVGFVPVVNDEGQPVGTVTDRDLVVRLLAAKKSPETRLDRLMSDEVVVCRPDDDIKRAEQLMEDRQKSRVVVVDQRSRCVGVISLSDIAQYEDEKRTGHLLRGVTQREVQRARVPS